MHVNKTFRTPSNELKIDSGFVASALSKAGFSPECARALQAEAESMGAKESLKLNTTEAVTAGAFGSPTMLVYGPFDGSPLLIFGSDRFEQLAFVLGKRWLGPSPSRIEAPVSRL